MGVEKIPSKGGRKIEASEYVFPGRYLGSVWFTTENLHDVILIYKTLQKSTSILYIHLYI